MAEQDTVMRLPRSWRVPVLGALVVSTAVLASTAGTAEAAGDITTADAAGPVITSHVDGQRVSGEIEVSVQTAAPEVWVTWGAETDAPWPSPVTTDEGVATASLTTSGYHGLTSIVVRECTSSSACEGPETSVQVDVQNPPPTFEPRAWMDVIYAPEALFTVTDEGPWAWYGFFFDGKYVPAVFNFPSFPGEALGDGEHTVQVAHCTKASHDWFIDPPVCDMENATEVRRFTVVTGLHPKITQIEPAVFSPDGNGAADSASVSLTVESPHTLIWELKRGTERVAGGDYVQHAAGPYTFTVDGLDDKGRPLPSGTYNLRLFAFVPNTRVLGETSTTLTIDNDAPSVTDISAGPSPFYPRRDGYRDAVNIRGTVSEETSRFRIRLFNDGHVLRRLWASSNADGQFARSWNGRLPSGQMLEPGRYRYDFVATDKAGNWARTPGGRIQLLKGR